MSGLTLGSLFDGSGGFPLGGLLSGITPVWASEIEPFPIRVTTKRLPFVKHYGDISRMDGGRIEPVDIITFGSPCQDMSIAGRRAGLDGERSGLFHQAIRIIKEMREKTHGEYPRYCVWENVPGAFSSNNGADFKAVLEAVIGVKEPACEVPPPGKNGWPYADVYLGDGWSVAYRTLDACGWGVPQRRRRIYLVADLAGGSAGKVLFESEGVSGYSAESFRAWQRAAGAAEDGAYPAGVGIDGYNGAIDTVAATLGVNCGMSTGRNGVMVLNDQGGHPPVVLEKPDAIAVENHPTDSRVTVSEDGKVQTLTPQMGTGGMNVPLLLKVRCGCKGGGKGALIQKDVSATISCNNDQTLFEPKVYGICSDQSHSMLTVSEDPYYIVRRLTPTECARLQGFPDWWCSGLGTPEPTMDNLRYWYDVFETHRKLTGSAVKPKTLKQIAKWLRDPHTDAAEYKMWGNGAALPCVIFVLSGIVYYAQL